ncbi:hypothetical protein HELRODRAFT_179116 [Helobdella robusta]|uniref:Uncharacterized protein n=1 Tax=Helobdella robusta TaxID=6412 RepID=T1FE66_HELRO|nr:hypothetical protein HELRODRAFT_179116 [Helobdella robusta]ESN95646.1 hypothetical protein HELRODRAFT_179116 [Helobdella robusta]
MDEQSTEMKRQSRITDQKIDDFKYEVACEFERKKQQLERCCSDSCCLVLVVRKPIRLDGPVKTGQGCAKADRLTDRPSENRPLVVRKPIRLDGPVKTGQGCAKADRLTDRPSENRPWVL